MAEIYFASCASPQHRQVFEAHMQSQLFNLKGIDAHGNEINTGMFGKLEEIKLYRYVLPKEAVPIALKTLITNNPNTKGLGNWAIKKALKLRSPTKEELSSDVKMNVYTQHVLLEVLGIKDDDVRIVANGVKQEAL